MLQIQKCSIDSLATKTEQSGLLVYSFSADGGYRQNIYHETGKMCKQ